MQVPLADLNPHWLDLGRRTGMGVRFQCPCDQGGEHEVNVWFMAPLDGSDPGTLSEDRQELYQHDGRTFATLSVYPPIRCGDCVIVIYEGGVNVIYLDDGSKDATRP